jgi:ubiquinone/menaquinone biosynthesis C-methylase UbiE
MLNVSPPSGRLQEQVNAYFQSSARYWKDIYETRGLLPQIYQRRQEKALTWIAQLPLRPASQILEIGCGAAMVSTALAHAGHRVAAIDPAPAMVEAARRQAVRCGAASRLTVAAGDAHALSFAAEHFDLVVAIGVIPWLHTESVAVSEMHRVLRPGGYLLLTADNQYRLNHLLDPISTPVFAPLRRLAKGILKILRIRRTDAGEFQARRHSPAEIDRMLDGRGLVKVRSATVGFGPFTFCGLPGFPDSLSIRIHLMLQRLADRDLAPVRLTGSHYIVLARKPCR